jgi:predicted AlkP superfamily pyrophosphatase or phosphodiesterase
VARRGLGGRRLAGWLGVLLAALAIPLPPPACADPAGRAFAERVLAGQRPRLTIVISIDQFRADYLRRFVELFLPARRPNGRPGGFRYLMAEGSDFIDAHQDDVPTFTCVGHALILSGSYPYKSGVVGNHWFDPGAQAVVSCTDDPDVHVVGAAPGSTAKPMGPRHLRVTTVGDELKLATNGAARVVSLSLKERAAIMMGGHTADVSLWFDETGGRWISSTAYARDGRLPDWVERINQEEVPARSFGTVWEPMVPPAVLARSIPARADEALSGSFGAAFPHRLGREHSTENFRRFGLMPAANAFVFETAERAISAERLGQRRDTPDLLAFNLATNDYVGHEFGPYSPEVADLTVRTDRLLADFLDFVDRAVPGGLRAVVVVLTADHGVAPVPEDLQARGIPAGRIPLADIAGHVSDALGHAFGGGPWIGNGADGRPVGAFVDPNLYLSAAAIEQALQSGKASSRGDIEAVAARELEREPGVYAAYTRTQLSTGAVPATDIGRLVTRGFHPRVSGDVMVVAEPGFWADEPVATTHGTPYAYDTLVPLLITGPGIARGVRTERVSVAGLAPTLSALLGIAPPSGSDSALLAGALGP